MKQILSFFALALFAALTIAQAADKFIPNPYTGKLDNVGKFDQYSGQLHLATPTRDGRMSKEDKVSINTYPFTPEKYGAVGDGVTDDSTAITSMFTAAMAANGKVYVSKMHFIQPGVIDITQKITVEGSGKQSGFLIDSTGTPGPAIKLTQDRITGTSPTYGAGLTGPAASTLRNFTIKRSVKDWTTNTAWIGLKVGDPSVDGYFYYPHIEELWIENFAIGIQYANIGHGFIGHNRVMDYGVAGVKSTAHSSLEGLGDNTIFDNYFMGDTQYHARDVSAYIGTGLETTFGGVAYRPNSTKNAAWYDLVAKYQTAGYWHEYGGGNKLQSNKAHFNPISYLINQADGLYMTGNNTSEFVLYNGLLLHPNATLYGGDTSAYNIVVSGNELQAGRPFVNYSALGTKRPAAVEVDCTTKSATAASFASNILIGMGTNKSSGRQTGINLTGSVAVPGINIGVNTITGFDNHIVVDAAWPAEVKFFPFQVAEESSGLLAGQIPITDTNARLLNQVDVHLSEISTGYVSRYERYNSSAAGANVVSRKARGVPSTPNAILSGDTIGSYRFEGHDGSGFGVAAINAVETAEDWTATNHGTKYTIFTVKSGETANAPRLSIDGNGDATFTGKVIAGGVKSLTDGYIFPDATTQTTAAKPVCTTTAGAIQFNSSGNLSCNGQLYTLGGGTLYAADLYFSASDPALFTDDYTTTGLKTAPSSTIFKGLSDRIPIITASTIPRMNSGTTTYENSSLTDNGTTLVQMSTSSVPNQIRLAPTGASGATGGGIFSAYQDDGAAIDGGERLLGIFAGGARDAAHTLSTAASIEFFSSPSVTWGSSSPAEIFFKTASTDNTRLERLKINKDGLMTNANGGGSPFGHEFLNDLTGLTIPVAASNTWYEIDGAGTTFTAGQLKNVTQSDHYLVATTAGYYKADYCVSIDTANPGDEIAATVAVNGTANVSAHSHSTVAAGNSAAVVCGTTFLNLAASDQVSIVVANHTAARDIFVHHAQLSILYSGSP